MIFPFWNWISQKPLRSVNFLIINEPFAWHFWYVDDEKIVSTVYFSVCSFVRFDWLWKLLFTDVVADCQIAKWSIKFMPCYLFGAVFFVVVLCTEAKRKQKCHTHAFAFDWQGQVFQVYLLIGYHMQYTNNYIATKMQATAGLIGGHIILPHKTTKFQSIWISHRYGVIWCWVVLRFEFYESRHNQLQIVVWVI